MCSSDLVAIATKRLKTNTVSNTAFRGFGGPQGMLAIERVMDAIARERGLDPLDVRKANLLRPGFVRTPYDQTVEDCESQRAIVEELGETRRKRQGRVDGLPRERSGAFGGAGDLERHRGARRRSGAEDVGGPPGSRSAEEEKCLGCQLR